MSTNPVRSTSLTSPGRGVKNSAPIVTASAALANSAKAQRAAPSQAVIAQKAYEIWLSQGQQPGCDQQHWFESELQLVSRPDCEIEIVCSRDRAAVLEAWPAWTSGRIR